MYRLKISEFAPTEHNHIFQCQIDCRRLKISEFAPTERYIQQLFETEEFRLKISEFAPTEPTPAGKPIFRRDLLRLASDNTSRLIKGYCRQGAYAQVLYFQSFA